MLVPRLHFVLISLVACLVSTASAAAPGDAAPPPDNAATDKAAPTETPPPAPPPKNGKAKAPAAAPSTGTSAMMGSEREELKRELMEEMKRELDKTKEEIGDKVSFLDREADARNYDASQLKELKQTVNLLQLHGYFRLRGDLFHNAQLGRGADQSGNLLFPFSDGGVADMRLRLNPILRISDDIVVHSQIDALDNAILGGNPLAEPFFDPNNPANILANRISGSPVLLKRVWAEVQTPVAQIAFGRMPLHVGEGLVYNDGNCLDCDFGTTFDRLQFTFGPFGFLKWHLFTVAVDEVAMGGISNDVNRAQQVPLSGLTNGYRLSLQITRRLPELEVKKRLDNNEWVVQYGALFAYRAQNFDTFAGTAGTERISAQFGEVDAHVSAEWGRLRLATESFILFGSFGNRPLLLGPSFGTGQSLDVLSGTALLRGQATFMKQESLLVSLDLGFASGDKSPGIGALGGQPSSNQRGDLNGTQFNCPGPSVPCTDSQITNFRLNQDFHIDQLLWRNLFVRVSDAYFARAEVRFKPNGRTRGGGNEDGFELSGAAVYSQAIYSQSTPSGTSAPLGVEFDVGVTYLTKDRFFAGLVGGFLVPLDGLNNPVTGQTASFAQVYRGILGVNF